MSVLRVVQEKQKMERKVRRPKHTFTNRFRPYQIQPCFIAPVLAGETLKNLNIKGRIVSDPLATTLTSALLPWWVQHFVFYVKLRDLLIDSDIEAMMLQGTQMPQNDAANAYSFHADATAIDWTKRAYERCVEEYFRDEAESVSTYTIDSVPAAHLFNHGDNFFENLQVDGATPTNNDLQNPHDYSVPSQYLEQYERMRAMRLIDMDFNDWLRTYGVVVADPVEKSKPELLRYTSTWHYPTNTVEPTTGTPSTALVAAVDESADKDRFFPEPGFIIAMHVVRAKIFPINQTSAAVVMLDDAFGWLPALMRDQPETSLREFINTAGAENGPFLNQTANYWIDRRDLFIHGDHFRNWTPSAGANFVAVPTAAGVYRAIDLTQVKSFFKDTAGTANYLYYDGVVNLNVLGHPTTVTDQT